MRQGKGTLVFYPPSTPQRQVIGEITLTIYRAEVKEDETGAEYDFPAPMCHVLWHETQKPKCKELGCHNDAEENNHCKDHPI